MCGERAGKHVYFTSQRLSIHLAGSLISRKLSQTRRKTTSSGLHGAAPRRILRAHPAPKSQRPRRSVGRDVRGRLPARYGPACARVRHAALIYGPTQCHNRSPTPSCVVRRHRFPLRKTCHALLRRPRRPSSAATRPPGAVPYRYRPRPEPRPCAARSTGWTCSGRALAARREGRKTSKIRHALRVT